MIRLFTALEIPESVGLLLSGLRGGLPGARWIDTEFYHVTLRFIGEVDGRTADEIADALARIERRAPPVRIDGLASFGGGKPHSVFARVDPAPALIDLQAEQERILQRLGLPPEGRKYAPHVTLARLRGVGAGDVARWLTLRGGFSLPAFVPARFVLFSSRTSGGGGPYIVEDSFPFAA